MGNRFFVIDDSSPIQVLPMDYYERNAHPSTRDVTVTFIYNCGAFSDQIDSGVWLVGSRAPLDWGAPDLSNPLDSIGNWIYQLDVAFPTGTNKNVEKNNRKDHENMVNNQKRDNRDMETENIDTEDKQLETSGKHQ